MMTTPSRSLLSHLPLLGLIPLLASCQLNPKVWVEDKKEFKLPAAGLQSVEVETHNGSIRIQGVAAAKETRIVARIRAGGQDEVDAKACLAAIHLEVETKAGVLHAGYKFGKKRGWQAQVSFEIHLPEKASVKAESHNGAIMVRGVKANIEAETHNGAVAARDCDGEWDLSTHNGSITAEGRSSNVELETHNGPVRVRLDTRGQIAGSITTHNGGVTVAVHREGSARISCETANGRIESELSLTETRVERTRLEGRLGKGETKLRVKTHNGSIRLTPTGS